MYGVEASLQLLLQLRLEAREIFGSAAAPERIEQQRCSRVEGLEDRRALSE